MITAGLQNRDAEILSSFTRLNSDAVQAIVGFTTDGSPLTDLLQTLAPEASQGVRDALIQGVALGHSPAKIAAQSRDALGGSLTRALTIARTETMRAYRDSSSQAYADNGDVLDGWTWMASLSSRTCAMCIAMHGTVHPVTEQMYSHPNCRCVMVPLVKGYSGPSIQSGSTWFNEADEATQLSILGQSAFDAFQSGAISLQDLVGTSDSDRWGLSRFVLSLSQVLGQRQAQKYGRKAA
jgi:SPP1 gp7 family putative phage head morphogenesis protein